MIVEAHVTINATKAAVWAATTDIARFAELLSGVEKIEVVERPANGLVGLKWKETRILFGKPATVAKWITEAKENEFYTTRAEQDGFVFITTNRISGSDGSVVLIGIHETRPQGFTAKLKALPMVLFKGVIRKAILQDLNDIKESVERNAPKPPQEFIEAELVLLPSEESGLPAPLAAHCYQGNYRVHIVIQPRQVREVKIEIRKRIQHIVDLYLGIAFWSGPDPVPLSTPFVLTMILMYAPNSAYDDVQPGAEFTLRAGSRIVGHGCVLKRFTKESSVTIS